MLFGVRVLSGLALVCGAGVAAQEIDAAAREAVMAPEVKGALVSRMTKEHWTAKDGQGRLTVYTMGDYELRLATSADGVGAVGVVQGGTPIYAAQSELGTSPPELLFEPTLGLDVDKDGGVDAVIGSFSGGMHCCYTYRVLSFAPKFRVGAVLDGGEAPLELVSGSGPDVVFRATDGVLGYWHTDFANSIFSDVYVQVNQDAVGLAEAWMKYPAPSDEEWAQMKAEAAAAFASKDNWMQSPENGEPPFAPRALMQQVVKLIYNGNGAHGLRLLQETWKGDAARPVAIAADLIGQLAKSQYWDGLKTLNAWSGEPADIAKAALAQ